MSFAPETSTSDVREPDGRTFLQIGFEVVRELLAQLGPGYSIVTDAAHALLVHRPDLPRRHINPTQIAMVGAEVEKRYTASVDKDKGGSVAGTAALGFKLAARSPGT